MRITRPDPNAEPREVAIRRFRFALKTAVVAVSVLWAILLADQLLALDLRAFGVQPWRFAGLVGLITMPLIHGGFAHLIHNSLPALTLITALLYFYPTVSRRVIAPFWIFPGLFVWFAGDNGSTHFGASGFNFALLGFLSLSGLLRREAGSLAISLAVFFFYGGMFSGILPIEPGVSWEGHLGGLIIGLLLAIVYRHRDLPTPKRYDWEDEDETEFDREVH